jgi:hypothetical protein
VIADIARDRESKTLPQMNADDADCKRGKKCVHHWNLQKAHRQECQRHTRMAARASNDPTTDQHG